jgi:hypothetical protein
MRYAFPGMPLMIKAKKKLFIISTLLAVSFFSLSFAQAAGTPAIISYQGRLANPSGDLLSGSYYFKFSIWNNPDVNLGTKLWPTGDPTAMIETVRQGVFNVNIGDTDNGYLDALDYNFNTDRDIYLQVEVSSTASGFQALSPRQRISSAPFAQVSGAVNGTGQSSFGTTTPISNAVVTIEATSTNATGLSIRGILGQLANIFQIQNSAGSNLFVVNNIGNVGIGTTTPNRKLNVLDANSSPQLRLSQSGSNYGEFLVDAAGDIHVSSNGGNFWQNAQNLWVCVGDACSVNTDTMVGTTTPEHLIVGKGNIIADTSLIFGNKFKLKQIDASTTIMYDTTNYPILEFDEGQ